MPRLHSYMLTLISNRSSRHTIQKPSRLWVFAVKNRAAPRRVRILASFKDFPYFLYFCKNRSWHSSSKTQCFATFNLASFKTTQYPCVFAHSRHTQKHPLFAAQPHRSWRPSTKPQRFAAFNLASFKTTQYPRMFAHSQTFKKHHFCPRPHHNLAAFKKTEEPVRVIEGLRRYEFWLSSSSGDECVSGGDDTPRKPRRRGKPKGVPPEGWVGSAPSALLPSLDVSSCRTRPRLDASHPRHFRPIAELL